MEITTLQTLEKKEEAVNSEEEEDGEKKKTNEEEEQAEEEDYEEDFEEVRGNGDWWGPSHFVPCSALNLIVMVRDLVVKEIVKCQWWWSASKANANNANLS